MISSKNSPIVHVQAHQPNHLYLRRRYAQRFEYTDVLSMLAICLVLYGLFIYYLLPGVAPETYQRSFTQLWYHWQVAAHSFEHQMNQTFLSLSHTLGFSEWIQIASNLF